MDIELEKLNSFNKRTIMRAGPRYSPAIDPKAPNIKIESSIRLINAIGLDDAFKNTVEKLLKKLKGEVSDLPPALERAFRRRKKTPERLVELLQNLARADASEAPILVPDLLQTLDFCGNKLTQIQRELSTKAGSLDQTSNEYKRLRRDLDKLRSISEPLNDCMAIARSGVFDVVENNALILLGGWGVGKTHFLCDVALDRGSQGLATIFVLAHQLETDKNPLDALANQFQPGLTGEGLLAGLNQLGKKKRTRALIFVDGVNEASRSTWKKHHLALRRAIARMDHVGLVLSCRTPFNKQIFLDPTVRSYVQHHHSGFEENEIDAQHQFFNHYGIPVPRFPILFDEFTRPLFLKLLCESLVARPKVERGSTMEEFVFGQKSMTKVFEDFVRSIGRGIEDELRLKPNSCWWILKGQKTSGDEGRDGIAVRMAESLREWLTEEDCLQVIAKLTAGSIEDSKTLQDKMISEGLLARDVRWEDDGWIDTIRFPYQRFSDHLIARYLLEKHLRTKSVNQLKRCFYEDRALGKIFETQPYSASYAQPGIASAIMMEFPERLKRLDNQASRELVHYLPRRNRLVRPFIEIFAEGLAWRGNDSVSDETLHILEDLVDLDASWVRRRAFEGWLTLSVRPALAKVRAALNKKLKQYTVSERDLIWSEYLRVCGSENLPYRLIRWIEESDTVQSSSEANAALIPILSWMLTTTNRNLRDSVTKCLVTLGEQDFELVFDHAASSLAINDPYVPERVLAASYGVLMRNQSSLEDARKEEAAKFGLTLIEKMFADGAPHRSSHVLARDYALGIIEIARKLTPKAFEAIDFGVLQPPFAINEYPLPDPAEIASEVSEETRGAIGMDFGNYTIGRLIKDRSNYDFGHEKYKEIRKQIEWRILDLGYDQSKFEEIDQEIARFSFYNESRGSSGKVDRYGKKYSWIAYFEVAGLIQADPTDDAIKWGERISEVDIDPSFPVAPRVWQPAYKPIFDVAPKSIAAWAGGDSSPDYSGLLNPNNVDGIQDSWVLLNGYIREIAPNDDREVFSFLRCLLIERGLMQVVREKFEATDYPGNRSIPDGGTDHYTFAGEIPWSGKFAGYLFDLSTGTWAKQTDIALTDFLLSKEKKRYGDLQVFERFQFGSGGLPNLRSRYSTDQDTESPEPFDDDDEVEVTIRTEIPGVSVEIPYWGYGWESYHSSSNPFSGFEYPAPRICSYLNLQSDKSGSELLDESGNKATIYCVSPDASTFDRSHLLYMRKDLLDRYLAESNLEMCWLIWGERTVDYQVFEKYSAILSDVRAKYKNIHKSFHEYRP